MADRHSGEFDSTAKEVQEDVLAAELEKVHVTEEGSEGEKKEETKEGEGEMAREDVIAAVLEKKVHVDEEGVEDVKKEETEGLLHRSHSCSSSSSSDEEEVDGEKKKKKKGLKEKIKEKISGQKKEGAGGDEKTQPEAVAAVVEDNTIPVEKVENLAPPESETQEKKTLLEKIKEKLPGGGHPKQPAEVGTAAAEPADHHESDSPTAAKEKKGFIGKIMDKIPGYKTNGAE
ncbi:unnamed protein product [Spirodela intermedia]|uniref:Uncharacterized protein n=1 Tax=Spirodela intermedia TaxID=51605 RepID=A0A7I8IEM2_SPIIN|nr:unnamed protein product [Spirodela intermedia]CAA6656071.1 unnamed protein product [Spirodela intermedia]